MASRWICLGIVLTVTCSAWAEPEAQTRFLVTERQVTQSLLERGITADESQVTILASVISTERDPGLEVLAVIPSGIRRDRSGGEPEMLVKVGCRRPGSCLPFYVVVKGATGDAGGAEKPTHPVPTLVIAKGGPSARETMRAGTHAVLIMNDRRMRIQIPVISLETGKAGETIHVASPDRKQVYEGEVVDGTLLWRKF